MKTENQQFQYALTISVILAEVFYLGCSTSNAQDAGPVFQQVTDFKLDLSAPGLIEDLDQTVEGKARLGELESKARTLYEEYKEIQRQKEPLAIPRDILVNEYSQAQNRLALSNTQGAAAARIVAELNQKKNSSPGRTNPQLNASLRQAEKLYSEATYVATIARQDMELREPRILALNNQINPLEVRMQQLWNELEECRRQWCSIRQPALKYARGDYQALRKVLDDWLLIDGLWPSAYVWAALCAHELGDGSLGIEYLQRAEDIRTKIVQAKESWPALSAAYGLLLGKMPGKASRGANKRIEEARSRMVKLEKSRTNTEWDAYFILGLVFSGDENDHVRAKVYFERALGHNPYCVCSAIGLARLQTTSTQDRVRDVDAGLKTIEKLWSVSVTKNWRLTADLAIAYSAAGHTEEAKRLWQQVAASDATDEQKESIRTALRIAHNMGK